MAGTRDFYTLVEAAQVLGVSQRRLLEMLETAEIEGEQDPLSGRWKISKRAVHELVREPAPADDPTVEESPGASAETILELVEELDNLQRELGRLKNRLELAQRAENAAWQEERELLLAELEQERERRRQEREQAQSTLQTERHRLLEDQQRERERADKLQEEAKRLREEQEAKRNEGTWRRLFGG